MESVLAEIVNWSDSQPGWQRDALRRLVLAGELSPDDESTLFQLALAENGHAGESSLAPQPLDATMIPGSGPASEEKVVFVEGVRHINRLANDQRLAFLPSGLTVIYGRNGVGKSGYTRMIKKACRARRAETIHPDAYEDEAPGTPSATFGIVGPNGDRTVGWSLEEPSDPAFDSIAVFDAACGRSFLSEDGSMLYQPYGADVLSNLATLIQATQARAKQEGRSLANVERKLPTLPEGSQVAAVAADLKAEQARSNLLALLEFMPADAERLEHLRELLKGDAVSKAQMLRSQAARMGKDAEAVALIDALVGDDAWKEWEAKFANLQAAVEAANNEMSSFADELGIVGAGTEEWRDLVLAAQKFAETHLAEGGLAALPSGQDCPLCNEPLVEGHPHLRALGSFATNQLQARAAELLRATKKELAKASKAWPRWTFDEPKEGEYEEMDSSVAAKIASYVDGANQRFEALAPMSQHAEVSALPDGLEVYPGPVIAEIVRRLHEQSDLLMESVDPETRTANQNELSELEGRKSLNDCAYIVKDVIRDADRREALLCLAKQATTKGVSQIMKDVVQRVATEALGKAMADEFRVLGVRKLAVVEGKTAAGTAKFSLQLEGKSKFNPIEILSEGEQRVVGIAGFLAELNTSASHVGLLFDDPVSSLDHKHRDRIARRLVDEAKRRQVIIFTHDMTFLNALSIEAEKHAVPTMKQCLTSRDRTHGIVKEGVPFEAATVSDRLTELNKRADALQGADLDDEALGDALRHAFTDLRTAWEREVEGGLLGGVISRYAPDVQTQRLNYVNIEASDIAEIDAGMDQCNAYAHDRPDALAGPLPALDEFRDAVKALKTAHKARGKRNAAHRQTIKASS